nr:hypothetical protein [Klebsiella pneumoniae]
MARRLPVQHQPLQSTATDGTSHRHLLHAEEGTWLNIDGFHMGIGGDDSGARQSAEFQLSAGSYHYQLLWCHNNNRAGHVCPYFA